MRVPAEAHRRRRESAVEAGEIQEDEGLEELAEVGRAHQPVDGPVCLPARAVDDFTDRLLKLTCHHDSSSNCACSPAEVPSFLRSSMSMARSVFASPLAAESMTAL